MGVIDNSALDDGIAYTLSINIPKPWEKLPSPKTFGDHIRLARMKKGWLVKKLARRVKVTPGTVTNWEKEGLRPDYTIIRKLKSIFPELAALPPSMIYKDYPSKPMTFGHRLKQKRLDLDLSQRELANRLQVCIDAMADWEAGRTRRNDPRFEKEIMEKVDLKGRKE